MSGKKGREGREGRGEGREGRGKEGREGREGGGKEEREGREGKERRKAQRSTCLISDPGPKFLETNRSGERVETSKVHSELEYLTHMWEEDSYSLGRKSKNGVAQKLGRIEESNRSYGVRGHYRGSKSKD